MTTAWQNKTANSTCSPTWCQKQKRKLLLLPQSCSQSKGQEGSSERHPQPQKEDPHVTHLPAAQDPWKSSPRRNTLTTMPSFNAPDHWVSHEEDRRQQTCTRCGCHGQQAADHTGCEAMTLMWPKSTPTEGLIEGVCSAGSWLWCLRCCQQNWDQLN